MVNGINALIDTSKAIFNTLTVFGSCCSVLSPYLRAAALETSAVSVSLNRRSCAGCGHFVGFLEAIGKAAASRWLVGDALLLRDRRGSNDKFRS